MANENRAKVVKFQRDIARWADMIGDFTVRKKAQASRAIVTELVTSTPVVTGLTRGNWRTSVGAVTSAVIGIRSAGEAISEAYYKVINTKKPGATIFIANHVPWLVKLNKHSLQAAPGWIDRAVARGIAVARSMRG